MGRIRPRPNIPRPDRPHQEQATEAQVRAMQEKLAARVKQVNGGGAEPCDAGVPDGAKPSATPSAKPPEATQSPKEKARVELDWERPVEGAMAVKSKCKRYSVSKVSVQGRISYELWKLAGGGGWFNQLANQLESFAKAKQLADEDANKC